MRRLVTALASLAVVFLLIPSIGLAIDPPVENGVGILCIFTAEDLEAADNVIPIVTPFQTYTLYFVLYNEQLESDVLGGFEFSWRIEPTPASAPILSRELPPNTVALGDMYNVMLGFGSGLPTTGNHALIVSYDVIFLASPETPSYIFLGPSDPPSIPGEIDYNDFNNPATILAAKPNSVGGLYENPVFGFNTTIATESETWGTVKSLFR